MEISRAEGNHSDVINVLLILGGINAKRVLSRKHFTVTPK